MNPSDFLIYFVHLQMTQDFSFTANTTVGEATSCF